MSRFSSMRAVIVCVFVLAAVCSLDFVEGRSISSLLRPSRSSSSTTGSNVDGFKLAQANANWFSVCKSATPVVPQFPPQTSPIPQPMIDESTSAVYLQVIAGKDSSCISWGYYSDDIETVGWGYLSIETNPAASDYLQSRGAGVLEGYLTQKRIAQYVPTLMPGFYPRGLTPAVKFFLNSTVNFNVGMIRQIASVDKYWTQVACVYLQLQGLFEGYTLAVTNALDSLSWFDMYSLQLDVDIGDITTAVGLYSPLASDIERQAARAKMAKKVTPRAADEAPRETHCSALVKLAPNNGDLFIGHDTWSGYNTMLRIFKLHKMPLRSSNVISVHQSSYPGFLFSSDDWYQLSGNKILLTVTETSNDIYDSSIYGAIQSGSVGIWARTIVANRLATDGPSWASVFSNYNSGTCDNQWIIINHNLFTPGAASLTPGLLTISEQTPGLIVTRDFTSTLEKQGYWSSFNIPHPELTYYLSGYSLCPDGPYECSYYENFRYLLFQEQQPSVVDLDTMQNILQYNDWQHDALQHNSSSFAIAARYDLTGAHPSNYGGIDAKVTSDSWMKGGQLRVSASSGPTQSNGRQQPFCWPESIKPPGQPTCWKFGFTEYYDGTVEEKTVPARPIIATQ